MGGHHVEWRLGQSSVADNRGAGLALRRVDRRAHARHVLIVVGLLMAGSTFAQLTYVESSVGLEQPGMEGGKTEIEFGDVNGDGHVDIVSIGDHGNPLINSPQRGLGIWFGNGKGQWTSYQVGHFGYGGIALGDVNNDGWMDVGYGMHHAYSSTDFGNQLLEVALGDGTGMNWIPWDDGLGLQGQSWGMFATDFADINNDGALDVGSSSFGCCDGLHVYLNRLDGSWQPVYNKLGGNSGTQFIFGDINGDGLADFATSHGSGTVYLGNGAGGFTPADGNLPGGAWRNGVSLGDVNNNGRDDLVFVTATGIAVHTWVSPGNWQNLSGSLATAGGYSLTDVADMNVDGFMDIVAMSGTEVAVFAGDGAGGWTKIASVALPASCGVSAFRAGADVDHNGYPDFIKVTAENCAPFTGGTNRRRLYRETSVPQSAWVHPVRPRGGEVFIAGGVRFVDWYAAVPPDAGQPVMRIELSLHGQAGPWSTIADGVPNNGRFQWTVPSNTPTTYEAALRFTLETDPPAVGILPGVFRIVGHEVSGDFDGDGDRDLADAATFLNCFTGQAGGSVPVPCPIGDFDANAVIDLADHAAFVAALTGP